jgi:hypothetical protein
MLSDAELGESLPADSMPQPVSRRLVRRVEGNRATARRMWVSVSRIGCFGIVTEILQRGE